MYIKQAKLSLVYGINMKKTFGNNLKVIRELNNLSQGQLALLLGTTQQRVSEWENGKVEPTLFNLIKLTRALNTSFEELTEGVEWENAR